MLIDSKSSPLNSLEIVPESKFQGIRKFHIMYCGGRYEMGWGRRYNDLTFEGTIDDFVISSCPPGFYLMLDINTKNRNVHIYNVWKGIYSQRLVIMDSFLSPVKALYAYVKDDSFEVIGEKLEKIIRFMSI
jgi:hypothetical protein